MDLIRSMAAFLAAARDRATHTGTQLAATISDFTAAVQALFGTTAGTVCEGNDARLSDARTPTGSAGGDLGGTYPDPTVTQARGLRETSGPTTLAVGAVADGEYLRRVGSDIVGATPAGATPAGVGTELQYRDGSALGAVAGTAWNGTTLTLPAIAGPTGVVRASVGYGNSSGACGVRYPSGFTQLVSFGGWVGVAIQNTDGAALFPTAVVFGPNYFTRDAGIYRDAADQLGQRNGTTPQTFRVYGTWSSGGNYERIALSASALALESAGTGSANRTLTLSALGTGVIACTSPVRVPSYTVATVPSASIAGAGAMIFVTDEAGGPVLAMSDGTDWRRVTDYAVIS